MSPCYRFIPKGPKYILSFERLKQGVGMCINRYIKNKETKKTIVQASFDPILCYGKGSKCYGTVVFYKGMRIFFIENINMYKNQRVQNMNWNMKYQFIQDLLMNVKPIKHHNTIYLGLPITRFNQDNAMLENIPYEIYSVEQLNGNNRKVSMYSPVQKTKYEIFNVKADLKPDIYHLYKSDYSGKAMIPNLSTSIMMNKLFRTIKENDNIDLIEESDNEDEFENIDEYQYVDINKSYHFRCMYNHEFKTWVPIECIDEYTAPEKLSSLHV